MPFNDTIVELAASLALLPNPKEDRFHGLYNAILNHLFPSASGFIIEPQVLDNGGQPEFVIVRGSHNRIVLVAELKRPSTWGAGGRVAAFKQLKDYIEAQFDPTIQPHTIHGIVGFGLRWKAFSMTSAEYDWTTVVPWHVSTHLLASYCVSGLISLLRII
jgi:hypothetical protein